ncbi:MAG: putative sulfate exporter family transporter, partial [candidate division Zixibacteria bacterium]|nr:putative sulfate exporter family transporter [candidate division Zixibacteria bacterium]
MQGLKALWQNEDYWAIWFAFLILGGALLGWIPKVPKITNWSGNPLNAFATTAADGTTTWLFGPLLVLAVVLALLTVIGIRAMRVERALPYLGGFIGVFVLSTIAYWIAHQTNIKYWGLSYAMWALLVGLLISNTIGTPSWLRAGAKTELFIKTGLVLLGAEVLFEKILSLGPPGLMVAWIVTPVVVVFMYILGTRKLRIRNSKLVMIIASATSVCGVSAAIAAAAACRAKKEDLTLAVGMTLI